MTVSRKLEAKRTSRDVSPYLGAPYVRMLIPDSEEGGFSAEILELPGCVSQGETAEEAYENLQDAMAGWIAASLDRSRPIPEPVGAKEYSGHFPLRMSTELHRAAALRAMYEGISLNQWIVRAIAERLAGEDLADRVASRLGQRLSVEVYGGFRLQYGGTGATGPQGFMKAPVSHPCVLGPETADYVRMAQLPDTREEESRNA